MSTFNYTFAELYGNQGEGTSSIDLTAGTPYTFTITNNSGSSYFTLETVRDYDGITPQNTSGSYTSLTNIATSVISDYIAGFSLPQGTNEFIFTPSNNVSGSTLRFRGTGGIILGVTDSPAGNPFYFRINTSGTSAGSSNNNQFTLPITTPTLVSPTPSLNITVDWGDGTTSVITDYNSSEKTHTYPSVGEYEINIYGDVRGWRFNTTGDRNKMNDIKNWGGFKFDFNNTFFGCNNMLCTATDAPEIVYKNLSYAFKNCYLFNGEISNWDISGVTVLTQMFFGATSFNQPIGSWDTSDCEYFTGMFIGATSFNQNIGTWDVTSGIDFINFMSSGTGLSSTNLSAIYNGWSAQAVQPAISISFGEIKYTSAGAAGREILAASSPGYAWTIIDGGEEV